VAERRGSYRISVGKPERRPLEEEDHLNDPGVDVKIILKLIFQKRNG
jgi:hypothetical protein